MWIFILLRAEVEREMTNILKLKHQDLDDAVCNDLHTTVAWGWLTGWWCIVTVCSWKTDTNHWPLKTSRPAQGDCKCNRNHDSTKAAFCCLWVIKLRLLCYTMLSEQINVSEFFVHNYHSYANKIFILYIICISDYVEIFIVLQ